MTSWFVLLAYLAAVNPPRLRPGLADGDTRGRPTQLALAAAIVVGAGLILVLGADDILGALDITDETWRLAAGVVCVLVGSRTVVAPALSEMPRSGRPALIPIAFPMLFTPQLAVLAVLFGATESVVLAWGWLALSVAAGSAGGGLRYRRPELWTALTRWSAAVLVIIGVALVVAGIRDV